MGFRIGNIDVLQFPTTSTTEPLANYNGLKPSVGELPAGFQKTARHRAFRANTIFEKDVAVPLRDGAIIRADVFRPADAAQKVPALVAWSPYGKNGTGRCALPAQETVSLTLVSASSPWTLSQAVWESHKIGCPDLKASRPLTLRSGQLEAMRS